MLLQVREADLPLVQSILREEYVRTTALESHDYQQAAAIYVDEAGDEVGSSCPACGHVYDMNAEHSCPDCGLCVG